MNSYFNSFFEKFLNNFNNNFQDWIKIIVQLSIVLMAYIILHRGLFWIATLPIDVYYSDFIYFEFLKRLISKPYLLLIV